MSHDALNRDGARCEASYQQEPQQLLNKTELCRCTAWHAWPAQTKCRTSSRNSRSNRTCICSITAQTTHAAAAGWSETCRAFSRAPAASPISSPCRHGAQQWPSSGMIAAARHSTSIPLSSPPAMQPQAAALTLMSIIIR